MDRILDFLSDYGVALTYEQLPESTIHKLKRLIIDTLGCSMGAYHEEPPRIARAHSMEVTSLPGSTVLGTLHRTSPELAAFANGVMSRYFDLNDTSMSPKSGHTSDSIMGVLAAAEYAGADMQTTLASLVFAYEAHDRFGAACTGLRASGWDNVNYVVLGSAAGAAKALGLDKEQMANALALAVVPNASMNQTRVGQLSMWKGCASGNASRNGVFAALIARRGLTGPAEAFEGPWGFKRQFGTALTLPDFGGRGVPFSLETAKFKCYPCDYEAQCSITPAVELHEVLQGDLDKIERVDIETYDFAIEIAADTRDKWNPTSRETADHSIPYIVAVALTNGTLWYEDFESDRIADPKIRDLMHKIDVRSTNEFNSLWPDAFPFRITVTTRSGEKQVREVRYAKGHPKNPMSDQEVEAKFRRLAEPVMGPSAVDVVLRSLWHLEDMKDVGQVLSLFALDSSTPK